jgi:hypothetical protein
VGQEWDNGRRIVSAREMRSGFETKAREIRAGKIVILIEQNIIDILIFKCFSVGSARDMTRKA